MVNATCSQEVAHDRDAASLIFNLPEYTPLGLGSAPVNAPVFARRARLSSAKPVRTRTSL